MSKQELLDEHKHVLGLSNIGIDIPAKRIHVIMGLSGSGKSTLIRHINRLIEPTDGHVIIDGDDVMKMSSDELMRFRRFKGVNGVSEICFIAAPYGGTECGLWIDHSGH